MTKGDCPYGINVIPDERFNYIYFQFSQSKGYSDSYSKTSQRWYIGLDEDYFWVNVGPLALVEWGDED